jgi:exonuclease SbcC
MRLGLARLGEMADAVQGLHASKQELEAVLSEADHLEESRRSREQSLTRLREEMRRASTDRDAAREVAVQKDYRMKTLVEAEEAHRNMLRLRRLKGEWSAASEAFEERRDRLKQIEEELESACRERESLEHAWHEAQAASLAQELTPGSPCPVCGSRAHPAPASFDGELPSKESLEEIRGRVKESEHRREAARREAAEGEKVVIRLDSEIRSAERGLGAEALTPGLLEKRLSETREACREAEQAKKRIRVFEEKIAAMEGEENRVRLEMENTEEAVQAALIRRGVMEGVVREREAKVAGDLRARESLEDAVKRAREQLEAMNLALDKAMKRHEQAVRDLSAKAEASRSLRRSENTARQHAEEAREAFVQRLQEGGFQDEDAFQASRRSESEMERLEREIQDYRGSLRAARERLQRAREAAEGLKEPDIPSLENEVERVKSEKETLGTQRGAAIEQSRQIAGWLETLQTIDQKRSGLEGRYTAVGKIADVAAGANPMGITFQRFVLASLLDDVLASASFRLRRMSGGRYDLQRARDRADQRSAGGLDLEVFDAHTGTGRLVNTLSGGEGFLASLSLALGLADVVQSYAGGIRLETIFVDEGFGSLDDESLDLAFRALVDLQGDGRLVGIISHVQELKERIDARLEVIPGRGGSKARFVL